MADSTEFAHVQLLFEYTKFHIGVYTTLTAALIALMNSSLGKRVQLPSWLVWTAVAFVSLAGLAGGVVASSLPWVDSLDAFKMAKIGPYNSELFTGLMWTWLEHTFFWLGIVSILSAFGWGHWRRREPMRSRSSQRVPNGR
jgi:hypothetical protein